MSISGRDARKFLQNYLTIDMDTIDGSRWRPAAICNIKGRAVATCRPVSRDSGILLLMSRDLLERVSGFLGKYIVFSKAEISLIQTRIFGITGHEADIKELVGQILPGLKLPDRAQNHVSSQAADMLFHRPGMYELLLHENADRFLSGMELQPPLAFQAALIQKGLPWVQAASSEAFIPQLLNYHEAGGVDFDKGCYLGQEVIARMQYRGAQKRMLVQLETAQAANAHPMQHLVGDDGRHLGQVVNAVSTESRCLLLAVVLRQALQEALYLQTKDGLLKLRTLAEDASPASG